MRHLKTTRLWLLCCATLLTSCQSPKVVTDIQELRPPHPPMEWFQPVREPYRPPIGATQRDAAAIIEEFRSKLAEANADKQFLADYFLKYFENE